MNIYIICSKNFYGRIPDIKKILEGRGDIITLPNHFDDPGTEDRYRNLGTEEHAKWKGEKMRHSAGVIENNNAVLVLNFEKNGIQNYIGGATFLEMYDAFRLGKKIYLYNDIPEGMLKDEIVGLNPILIAGDLSLIK